MEIFRIKLELTIKPRNYRFSWQVYESDQQDFIWDLLAEGREITVEKAIAQAKELSTHFTLNHQIICYMRVYDTRTSDTRYEANSKFKLEPSVIITEL